MQTSSILPSYLDTLWLAELQLAKTNSSPWIQTGPLLIDLFHWSLMSPDEHGQVGLQLVDVWNGSILNSLQHLVWTRNSLTRFVGQVWACSRKVTYGPDPTTQAIHACVCGRAVAQLGHFLLFGERPRRLLPHIRPRWDCSAPVSQPRSNYVQPNTYNF
jgi:hypothetical protein